jgi:hypothetical protein
MDIGCCSADEWSETTGGKTDGIIIKGGIIAHGACEARGGKP